MVQGTVRLMLFSLLLAGCTTMGPRYPGEAGMPDNDPLTSSPAMSLVNKADQARAKGDNGAAERYLERALNLAPDSSWIYHQLAQLRLAENQPEAAEGFIQRALRNAPPHSIAYQASLYDMLATCKEQEGDMDGADDARSRARDLRSGL